MFKNLFTKNPDLVLFAAVTIVSVVSVGFILTNPDLRAVKYWGIYSTVVVSMFLLVHRELEEMKKPPAEKTSLSRDRWSIAGLILASVFTVCATVQSDKSEEENQNRLQSPIPQEIILDYIVKVPLLAPSDDSRFAGLVHEKAERYQRYLSKKGTAAPNEDFESTYRIATLDSDGKPFDRWGYLVRRGSAISPADLDVYPASLLSYPVRIMFFKSLKSNDLTDPTNLPPADLIVTTSANEIPTPQVTYVPIDEAIYLKYSFKVPVVKLSKNAKSIPDLLNSKVLILRNPYRDLHGRLIDSPSLTEQQKQCTLESVAFNVAGYWFDFEVKDMHLTANGTFGSLCIFTFTENSNAQSLYNMPY